METQGASEGSDQPSGSPDGAGARGRRIRLQGGTVLAVVGVTLLVLVVLAAVGSSDPLDARLSELSIIDDDELPTELIDEEDLERYPPDSPQRAFLEWWSQLQFRSWPDAIAQLDTGLRETIGSTVLIDGFEPNSAWYPTVQPRVLMRKKSRGGVSLRYAVSAPDGEQVLIENAVLVDTPGGWRIVYDSTLDSAVRAGLQERIRIEEDPTLGAPPPRAVRASQALNREIKAFLIRRLGAKP